MALSITTRSNAGFWEQGWLGHLVLPISAHTDVPCWNQKVVTCQWWVMFWGRELSLKHITFQMAVMRLADKRTSNVAPYATQDSKAAWVNSDPARSHPEFCFLAGHKTGECKSSLMWFSVFEVAGDLTRGRYLHDSFNWVNKPPIVRSCFWLSEKGRWRTNREV